LLDDSHGPFMHRALSICRASLTSGGPPFGCVVVRDGAVLAEAANTVRETNNPADHAEMRAVAAACSTLRRSDLGGCRVYAIAHPCPMCLACLVYAKPDRVCYAVDLDEKEHALGRPPSPDPIRRLSREWAAPRITMECLHAYTAGALRVLEAWRP
jgi:tRNA(Arg) A34 adenosine deaminase TadA